MKKDRLSDANKKKDVQTERRQTDRYSQRSIKKRKTNWNEFTWKNIDEH